MKLRLSDTLNIESVPVGGNIDVPAVNTYRIGFRQSRRLRVTGLEFISVVGINSYSVALYFPVARYFDVCPIGRTDCRVGDVGRQVLV